MDSSKDTEILFSSGHVSLGIILNSSQKFSQQALKSPHFLNREYGIELIKQPSEDLTLDSYGDLVEIYNEEMAPTLVYAAVKPETKERVAIKKIFKKDLIGPYMKRQAAQEFPLHCSLKHENIVKAFEWCENEEEYTMEMEFMNKAEYLKDKIDVNLNPIKSELKMKSYMADILEGLNYLHQKGNLTIQEKSIFLLKVQTIEYKGLVHGDIKLENCLAHKYDEESLPIVKLCDFGLTRFIDKSSSTFLMENPVGSKSYMAREIKANAQCSDKIDIWAMGILLYKMAVAYRPNQIAGYKYGSGPIPFRKVDWKRRSHELQDLVTKLLEYEPEKRISCEEALSHPWFQI